MNQTETHLSCVTCQLYFFFLFLFFFLFFSSSGKETGFDPKEASREKNERARKKSEGPVFSFGLSGRDPVGKQKIPGPGAYELAKESTRAASRVASRVQSCFLGGPNKFS